MGTLCNRRVCLNPGTITPTYSDGKRKLVNRWPVMRCLPPYLRIIYNMSNCHQHAGVARGTVQTASCDRRSILVRRESARLQSEHRHKATPASSQQVGTLIRNHMLQGFERLSSSQRCKPGHVNHMRSCVGKVSQHSGEQWKAGSGLDCLAAVRPCGICIRW